jgi:hypothetical protein
MTRRTSLHFRLLAASLALGASASASFVGCIAGTLTASPDAGSGDARAADATPDTKKTPAVEASCAVDAGRLSDAEVALGFAVVTASNCFSCHGPQLAGNQDGVFSPTAEGGLAYPPNLTPDPATGIGCWTNAQITNAFLNGIDDEGQPLCAPMPHFGALGDGGIDDAQAAAVVQYLRSIPAISRTIPSTPNCPTPPPVDASGDVVAEAATDAGADAASDAATDASADVSADGGGDAGAANDATIDGASDAAGDATTDAGGDAATDAGADATPG